MFNVSVMYAYAGPTNITTSANPIQDFPIKTLNAASLYPSIIYLNFTFVSGAGSESCDAKFEAYLIQFQTDTGLNESYAYYEGTNFSPSLGTGAMPNPTFNDLIDMGPESGIGTGAGFVFNLTPNESVWGRVSSSGSFQSGPSGLGLWSAGQPNTISVSVRRLGWLTYTGNSAQTTFAADDVIAQVQLERFGNGFLYNTVVPEDSLSQIDFFSPPIS
jgi:hypothetical protein